MSIFLFSLVHISVCTKSKVQWFSYLDQLLFWFKRFLNHAIRILCYDSRVTIPIMLKTFMAFFKHPDSLYTLDMQHFYSNSFPFLSTLNTHYIYDLIIHWFIQLIVKCEIKFNLQILLIPFVFCICIYIYISLYIYLFNQPL